MAFVLFHSMVVWAHTFHFLLFLTDLTHYMLPELVSLLNVPLLLRNDIQWAHTLLELVKEHAIWETLHIHSITVLGEP